MGKILTFLAGASLAFLIMWSFKVEPTQMIALSWFSGVLIGGWFMAVIMFLFSQTISNKIIKGFYQPRQKSYIPFVEVVEEDENIYDDANWWKDERKRKKHKRDIDDDGYEVK